MKRALYWHSRDRKYRATKLEKENGSYLCPKCGQGLGKAVYKRKNGVSERLLGCGGCLWLIREGDVDGCAPKVNLLEEIG